MIRASETEIGSADSLENISGILAAMAAGTGKPPPLAIAGGNLALKLSAVAIQKDDTTLSEASQGLSGELPQ